ncbi:hypothetical protein BDV11DRAFT_196915 [Aspergillus similis]
MPPLTRASSICRAVFLVWSAGRLHGFAMILFAVSVRWEKVERRWVLCSLCR